MDFDRGGQPEVAFREGHTLCPCINVFAFNLCLTLPVTISMTVSVGLWAKEQVAGMPTIAGKESPVFWTPVYTRYENICRPATDRMCACRPLQARVLSIHQHGSRGPVDTLQSKAAACRFRHLLRLAAVRRCSSAMMAGRMTSSR